MNYRLPKPSCSHPSGFRHLNRCLVLAAAIHICFALLLPGTATAHPQLRQGFYLGLGIAQGSMTVSVPGGASSEATSGSGGIFRLGWVVNPKFALGLESNSWVKSSQDAVGAVGTSTIAASIFPVEGLVLRGGIGAGYAGGAGDGLGGEVGMGWTASAAYEFRVLRTFAIGPEIDYARANLEFVDNSYVNVGLLMTWYFIPK